MSRCLDEHSHDIALLHDQVLVTVDLYLSARPLAKQHSVAGLNVDQSRNNNAKDE